MVPGVSGVDIVHGSAFYRPELVAHATTKDERDHSMPTQAKTATAKTAPAKATPKAKPTIDATRCRGGEGRYLAPKTMKACSNPRHVGRQLCDPCEAIYRAAKKATRAKATEATPTTAPTAKVTPIRRTPKVAPAQVPQRVAAMVAPEVTVTKK